MIKGFAHVCLAAKDLAAAEAFYCKGLGLRKAFDFIREGRVIGIYLQVGPRSYIEIFQADSVEAKAVSPILHFCLEVEDIDDAGRRLTDHGYPATEKKLGPDQSWQMWTTDPSGARIEFHQYTERSCQLTRQNCVLG